MSGGNRGLQYLCGKESDPPSKPPDRVFLANELLFVACQGGRTSFHGLERRTANGNAESVLGTWYRTLQTPNRCSRPRSFLRSSLCSRELHKEAFIEPPNPRAFFVCSFGPSALDLWMGTRAACFDNRIMAQNGRRKTKFRASYHWLASRHAVLDSQSPRAPGVFSYCSRRLPN